MTERTDRLSTDELRAFYLRYVDAAFDRGEAAIVIAVAAHADGLRERLARVGRDVDALVASGQLSLFTP